MTWLVLLDSNHCKIYSYQKKPISLKSLYEVNHEELRLKKKDFLTTDRPGLNQAIMGRTGTYSPPTDPKEVEVIHFIREIAETLDHARKQRAFDKLILMAPPHVNGLLMHHLNKRIRNLIISNIKKDYVHERLEEIMGYLKENSI